MTHLRVVIINTIPADATSDDMTTIDQIVQDVRLQ